MTIPFPPEILAIIFINVVAFLIMMLDKIKSRKTGARRISEGKMFFMATIFGSVGVYIGMFAFRHKTKKWYFLVGMPLMILQNSALIYLAVLWLPNYI